MDNKHTTFSYSATGFWPGYPDPIIPAGVSDTMNSLAKSSDAGRRENLLDSQQNPSNGTRDNSGKCTIGKCPLSRQMRKFMASNGLC